MVEITEDKFDGLYDNVEKGLRYFGKAMSCLDEMKLKVDVTDTASATECPITEGVEAEVVCESMKSTTTCANVTTETVENVIIEATATSIN